MFESRKAVIGGLVVEIDYSPELAWVRIRGVEGRDLTAKEGMRVVQAILNGVDERPVSERAELAWYRCTSCGGDFDSRELLGRHEREAHAKTVEGVIERAMGEAEQAARQVEARDSRVVKLPEVKLEDYRETT